MGEIIYQRHVGKGATEDDKPYPWLTLFIVQCHVHFFHLTVSIRVAFFLAHKQARGPSCRSRPVACGYPDTSPTIACPGSRSSSSTARHQSNQTAPGCFMVFCSTCPLAILHQSCSSQAPQESHEGGRGHRC